MATEKNPKKVTTRRDQDRLKEEATDRAFNEMMDQLPDGSLKKNLRILTTN